MKKGLLYIAFFTLTLGVMPMVHAVQAANLSFNPSSVSADVDETFELEIVVDAEDKEVLGVDALLEYDTNMLEVQGISDGTYLSIGQKDSNESGKVYVAGVVNSPGESVTGVGVLATITFKAIGGGEGDVKYICEIGETNESNISENSTDAPDLIECSSNGKAVITVAGGAPSGGGDDTGGGTGSTPTELPQSGVLDNFLAFIAIGGVLLIIGSGAKLISRVS